MVLPPTDSNICGFCYLWGTLEQITDTCWEPIVLFDCRYRNTYREQTFVAALIVAIFPSGKIILAGSAYTVLTEEILTEESKKQGFGTEIQFSCPFEPELLGLEQGRLLNPSAFHFHDSERQLHRFIYLKRFLSCPSYGRANAPDSGLWDCRLLFHSRKA